MCIMRLPMLVVAPSGIDNCCCRAGTDTDYHAVSTTLQQLRQIQVTQQLLLSTGAGKAMKALTKSSTSEVSEAAQQVVKAWKRCLLE